MSKREKLTRNIQQGGVAIAAAILLLLGGCAKLRVAPYDLPPLPKDDSTVQTRAISQTEINRILQTDTQLTEAECLEILSRLNIRANHYVEESIKKGKKLKVPNDFGHYKDWTPLPSRVPGIAKAPKAILVVKDIPFLGRYEKGALLDDTYICIGKQSHWTKAGVYKVQEKDETHFSMSYKDDSGQPAPMPYALRIYEHVWIHAGDIPNENCSHGCINVPVMAAMDLYRWAGKGTVVVIVESLNDLDKTLKKPASTPPSVSKNKPKPKQKQTPSKRLKQGAA
ncbi:MAG: L,D-transpeptidase [Syntrophobacteraceae bacterium]